MNKNDLEELKRLDEAATPAGWLTVEEYADNGAYGGLNIVAADGAPISDDENQPRDADAQLIVALRNAAPALIAIAERAASNPASPAQVDFEQNEITAAFDAHHEFYEFPSEALRGGALNEWTWGWWAGARAERAKSAAVPASPAPVAAIKTWRERMAAMHSIFTEPGTAAYEMTERECMTKEIADLRAALAAAAPQAQAEPGLVRYCPACGSIGDVAASYRDCCPDGSMARRVPKEFAEHCRATFRLAIGHAAPVVAAAPSQDAKRIDFIENSTVDLRCHDAPTGGDDYDVHWTVIEHYEAEPHEREIGWGKTPRAAIDDAIARGASPAAGAADAKG